MNIKPRTIKNVHARRAAICLLIPIVTIVALTACIFYAIFYAIKILFKYVREYSTKIKRNIQILWKSDFKARSK